MKYILQRHIGQMEQDLGNSYDNIIEAKAELHNNKSLSNLDKFHKAHMKDLENREYVMGKKHAIEHVKNLYLKDNSLNTFDEDRLYHDLPSMINHAYQKLEQWKVEKPLLVNALKGHLDELVAIHKDLGEKIRNQIKSLKS